MKLLFVKVENDGFDLGAQTTAERKERPAGSVRDIWTGHKKAQKTQESKMALTVSRKRLLESPDINLSGDRYRVTPARASNGKWPMVKLGEVCDLQNGTSFQAHGLGGKQAGGATDYQQFKIVNDSHGGIQLLSAGKVDDRLDRAPWRSVVFLVGIARNFLWSSHLESRTDGILNQHIFNVATARPSVNRQILRTGC